MSIKNNVMSIREQIYASAKKSARDPSEIKLIGVTKTVGTSQIKELLAAGITEIGENRVQDFLPKYEFFSQESEMRPREWHFIGHLQRNKVKYIIDKVDLIHSVDSIQLAEEINRRAKQAGKIVKILAEVNISGESSKFGIPPSEILKFAENLANMRAVSLCGLMCMAPFVENPEENRVFFTKMRKLNVDIQTECLYDTRMVELSMGMSNDFSIAIEEGATIIRIGTALFN
ncbi:MAG: YggS family pyridoxal phosphate-dependent enzyme [Clostridiales bacterium]|jgi:pyridoxal phosphate enzyme (YggS family)|nr:YggS family pyridoxal phosphate-dependent enzyme [Clostridiales bacterium]